MGGSPNKKADVSDQKATHVLPFRHVCWVFISSSFVRRFLKVGKTISDESDFQIFQRFGVEVSFDK